MSDAIGAIVHAVEVLFGSHMLRPPAKRGLVEELIGVTPLGQITERDNARVLLRTAHRETMARGWEPWLCHEAHPDQPCPPEKFWRLRAIDLALPHSCLLIRLDARWLAVDRITDTKIILRDEELKTLPLEEAGLPTDCWVLRRSF